MCLLSIYLSIHLLIRLSIHLPTHPFIYPPSHFYIHSLTYQPSPLFKNIFTYSFLYVLIYPYIFIHPSIHLSMQLLSHLPTYKCIYQHACLLIYPCRSPLVLHHVLTTSYLFQALFCVLKIKGWVTPQISPAEAIAQQMRVTQKQTTAVVLGEKWENGMCREPWAL